MVCSKYAAIVVAVALAAAIAVVVHLSSTRWSRSQAEQYNEMMMMMSMIGFRAGLPIISHRASPNQLNQISTG